jgi:hypothetical protein
MCRSDIYYEYNSRRLLSVWLWCGTWDVPVDVPNTRPDPGDACCEAPSGAAFEWCFELEDWKASGDGSDNICDLCCAEENCELVAESTNDIVLCQNAPSIRDNVSRSDANQECIDMIYTTDTTLDECRLCSCHNCQLMVEHVSSAPTTFPTTERPTTDRPSPKPTILRTSSESPTLKPTFNESAKYTEGTRNVILVVCVLSGMCMLLISVGIYKRFRMRHEIDNVAKVPAVTVM